MLKECNFVAYGGRRLLNRQAGKGEGENGLDPNV